MLKRILPLILVALMIFSLYSCSNPEFEHPISVSKLTDSDLKSVMLDYENELILELLNKGKWVDDNTNCGYDYELEFGSHNVLYYHSECGTFIDVENSRSLTVSEQDKNKINESLNRSFKLPLGNKELLNLFSDALNEKGLHFGMFESEMLDFVDSLTFEGKPVNECDFAPVVTFFDGESVCGIVAYGDKGLGYGCKLQKASDVITVSNNFNTTLAIEGLPLPVGIKFGDDINKVLSAILGHQFNHQTDFSADKDVSTDMTLARSDGNSSYLILHDFRKSTLPVEYEYPLSIEFVELNCVYDGEKLTKKQSRSILIFFDFPMIDKEVPTIGKVEFSVIDTGYGLKHSLEVIDESGHLVDVNAQEEYYAGEIVTLKGELVYDTYLSFYADDKRIEVEQECVDNYIYYSFVMPDNDTTVICKLVSVSPPPAPQ